MPPPSNTTALTAIALTPPDDLTQDVNDAGTSYTVWYSYTAVDGDTVIGVYAYGDFIDYFVNTKIYTGPAAAPVGYLLFTTAPIAQDKPVQFPVVSGTTYYFEFISAGGNVAAAVLNLSIGRAPNSSIDAGDIIINDENAGYPTTIVDPTNADPKAYVTGTASGEHGAIFYDTNYLCLEDQAANEAVIYLDLAEVATVTFAHAPASFISIGSNRSTKFYLGNQGISPGTAAFVRRVNNAGAFDAPTWTLPTFGLLGMAPDLNDSILYWGRLVDGDPVRRYDLINDVPLSDLFAGLAGYYVGIDMFVLQDDTILASFLKTSAGVPQFIVKRFNAAGTTLNTYNFTTGTITTHRMAVGEDDPDSFWIKIHQTGGAVEFQHVRISDGAILVTINSFEFSAGKSQHTYAFTPGAQFGQAPSCPFFITRTGFGPTPPAEGGMFILVPDKRTDHNGVVDVAIPNPIFRTALLP